MRHDANTSWFSFSTEAVTDFAVFSFRGREALHEPYRFTVDLVHRSPDLDIRSLLGKPACLAITDRSGERRWVHGLVQAMDQLETAHSFTRYRCVLVPRLWFLGLAVNNRIFQNLSVVEILGQILRDQGFTDDDMAFFLSGSYETREYCTQYGETDLHCISRLCEEEGLFFYFEHG
ncbi:MAG: type VI secretion system tip protein VgrG, partial [Deltaproteobacteria bacterium]|nr:type VI secretion system tip protein VgrG [Deltaproteobacteria bacterium]